jgi:cytochrome c biogenesis protein CcmG/thiol:disulfide interchange protein DsbE
MNLNRLRISAAALPLFLFAAETAPGVRATIQPVAQRKPAPEIALTDSTGKPLKLADYRGKIVLLNFWATWCGGCKEEMPWYSQFEKTYGPQGFAVIGVSLDEDGWGIVKPFLAKTPIPYRIVLGTEATGKKYNVDAMPVSYLLDRQGRIAVSYTGLVDRSNIENNIKQMLASKTGS